MRLVVALALGSLGIVAASGSACLPDAKKDYDDFISRTAGIPTSTLSATDAAPIDARPPDTAVEGLYVGICVTLVANSDPNSALRFYTETKYTPDGPGSPTGKLSMVMTSLLGWDVAGSKPVKPASVSKSETRGDAIILPETPVSAAGRATMKLGTLKLSKEANTISGADLVIDDTVLEVVFGSGDRFCAGLGGQLTNPYKLALQSNQNTCLFQRVKDGDPVPDIAASDFVCKF